MKWAIVGASGLVGQTFVQVLSERKIDPSWLTLLASERSAGQHIPYLGHSLEVKRLDAHSFDAGFDVVLFSAGASVSKTYAPLAAQHARYVIDNSSAWRMDAQVPLVVPEVNLPSDFRSGLIANPNCSTIQSVMALSPLKAWGLKRIVYTTYQAVSGSGQKGLADLERTQNQLDPQFYPQPIHENVLPQIDALMPEGDTKEEWKMIEETRKILELPQLAISATCVRVPVRVGHSVAINVEFERSFELDEIHAALAAQKGVTLKTEGIITPREVAGSDAVWVARVRRDRSVPHGLNVWVVADNVRKGAASNAVQIALALLEKEMRHV